MTAEWKTWSSTAHDCDWPIYFVTDRADYLESGVLVRESTLDAEDIMREAMK